MCGQKSQQDNSQTQTQMDEIERNLYVGDLNAFKALLTAPAHIQKNWCVVTVMRSSELEGISWKHTSLYDHQFLEVQDAEREPISMHFHLAHLFIASNLINNKKVLVHCDSGISRSPTIAAAHLIAFHGYDYLKALRIVAVHHPKTAPRAEFINQLREFSTAINGA
jgi:dual specificity phosphatase 12